METKYITIPFDLERARRIQEGKEEGKIVTRNGRNARIVCWDVKNKHYSLVVLITSNDGKEDTEYDFLCTKRGFIWRSEEENKNDLVLEVPEYTKYKDGDILIIKDRECPFIYKGINGNYCDYYVGINPRGDLKFRSFGECCLISQIGGYANEEQRQKLINALQKSEKPLAKEYLKRFFNIEEAFKPFDRVLVRDARNIWNAAFFSHYNEDSTYPYFTTVGCYKECIPYNKEIEYLLGTSIDY